MTAARDTYLCWDQAELLATLTPREAEAWARAARGAEWLDEVDPGWARRIEEMLPWLAMGDARFCVGGLCHGHYFDALDAWELTEEDGPDMGLEAWSTDPRERASQYHSLREVWRTLTLMRCGRVS